MAQQWGPSQKRTTLTSVVIVRQFLQKQTGVGRKVCGYRPPESGESETVTFVFLNELTAEALEQSASICARFASIFAKASTRQAAQSRTASGIYHKRTPSFGAAAWTAWRQGRGTTIFVR